MYSQRDKTEEQQEREKRAKALRKRFKEYQNKVRPKITYEDIRLAEGLDSGTISKLLNGHEEFDRPIARTNLVKCINVFIRRRAIQTLDEANELLQIAGFEQLHRESEEDLEVAKLLGEVRRERKEQKAFEMPKYETIEGMPVVGQADKGEEEYTNDDDEEPQEIGLSRPSKYHLLMDYIETLNELLTLASKALPGTSDTINSHIIMTTAKIYELLSPKVQAVFSWLGVIPNRSSIMTVIMIGRTKEGLHHEDYYAVFDLLYRCNLIVPSFIREELTRQEALQFLYKFYEGELPLPYEGDYLWQFRHPVIRNFALARLDEKHECELMKQRCLNFYYSLFSIFIMAKYGWGRTPAELAKMEEFSRLSSEYAAFSQAMREMREARYQYIKERLIASYYQNLDLYEETLNALKLPPETLTQRQEDLIEDYATIYEEVTKDPKCPYPLAEWFWKYLDYELNPNYFATPNVFAVMNGRLAIYAMMDEDKVPARININNL